MNDNFKFRPISLALIRHKLPSLFSNNRVTKNPPASLPEEFVDSYYSNHNSFTDYCNQNRSILSYSRDFLDWSSSDKKSAVIFNEACNKHKAAMIAEVLDLE